MVCRIGHTCKGPREEEVVCSACGWPNYKFGINYTALNPYCYLCLRLYDQYKFDPNSMPPCLKSAGCEKTRRTRNHRIECTRCRLKPIFNEAPDDFDESVSTPRRTSTPSAKQKNDGFEIRTSETSADDDGDESGDDDGDESGDSDGRKTSPIVEETGEAADVNPEPEVMEVVDGEADEMLKEEVQLEAEVEVREVEDQPEVQEIASPKPAAKAALPPQARMTLGSRVFASREPVAAGEPEEKSESTREEISEPVRPKDQKTSTRVTRDSRAFATKESVLASASEDKPTTLQTERAAPAVEAEPQLIQPKARSSLGSTGSSENELAPSTRKSRAVSKGPKPLEVPTIVVSPAPYNKQVRALSAKLPAPSSLDADVDVDEEPRVSRKRSISEDRVVTKKLIRQSLSPERPSRIQQQQQQSQTRLCTQQPTHYTFVDKSHNQSAVVSVSTLTPSQLLAVQKLARQAQTNKGTGVTTGRPLTPQQGNLLRQQQPEATVTLDHSDQVRIQLSV